MTLQVHIFDTITLLSFQSVVGAVNTQKLEEGFEAWKFDIKAWIINFSVLFVANHSISAELLNADPRKLYVAHVHLKIQ